MLLIQIQAYPQLTIINKQSQTTYATKLQNKIKSRINKTPTPTHATHPKPQQCQQHQTIKAQQTVNNQTNIQIKQNLKSKDNPQNHVNPHHKQPSTAPLSKLTR